MKPLLTPRKPVMPMSLDAAPNTPEVASALQGVTLQGPTGSLYIPSDLVAQIVQASMHTQPVDDVDEWLRTLPSEREEALSNGVHLHAPQPGSEAFLQWLIGADFYRLHYLQQ